MGVFFFFFSQDVERLEMEGAEIRYELKEHERLHLEQMEQFQKTEQEKQRQLEHMEQVRAKMTQDCVRNTCMMNT